MTLHSLPLFVRLQGRPVILLGKGEAADAKRRLLDRAGAQVVGEDCDAALAIVAIEAEEPAHAAVARLKARGILVNAVDRPALCDFTLPAIVDRAPVLVAIGTGGISAGLAAALRQRLEALLPAGLGRLAKALYDARDALRERHPDAGERRRAIAEALAPGGRLDLLIDHAHPSAALPLPPSPIGRGSRRIAPEGEGDHDKEHEVARITLASPDPDDLTLRQARLLANADRVVHGASVPHAILDRARADAERLVAPAEARAGRTVIVEMD